MQRATIPFPSAVSSLPLQWVPADDIVGDSTLVLATINGDRTAFDALIHRYQRQALAVSYRLLGNSHDAMEVVQEAFLKAYTNLRSLQKPEAFAGWLLRIVSNLSLNARRGRKSRSTLQLSDLVGDGDSAGPRISPNSPWSSAPVEPMRRLESQEMGEQLSAALAQLPEKQQLALVMFTIEQLPQKDIADALACSVEAVKWHVFQGRRKLRKILKEHLRD